MQLASIIAGKQMEQQAGALGSGKHKGGGQFSALEQSLDHRAKGDKLRDEITKDCMKSGQQDLTAHPKYGQMLQHYDKADDHMAQHMKEARRAGYNPTDKEVKAGGPGSGRPPSGMANAYKYQGKTYTWHAPSGMYQGPKGAGDAYDPKTVKDAHLRQQIMHPVSAGGPGSGRHPGGNAEMHGILKSHGFQKSHTENGDTHYTHPKGHEAVIHPSGNFSIKGPDRGATPKQHVLGNGSEQLNYNLKNVMHFGGQGSGRHADVGKMPPVHVGLHTALIGQGFKHVRTTPGDTPKYDKSTYRHKNGNVATVQHEGTWQMHNTKEAGSGVARGYGVRELHEHLSK